MSADRVYDEATRATAEAGVVMLDGPNGVAVSLTPRAALATAEAIRIAAEEAQRQAGDVSAPR